MVCISIVIDTKKRIFFTVFLALPKTNLDAMSSMPEKKYCPKKDMPLDSAI
jgi:hypothetical protein